MMIEVGRWAQDVAQLFEPVGRWFFVKIVVLAFCLSALIRAVPWKPRRRRSAAKRPKRAVAGVWAAGATVVVCSLVAAVLVVGKADRQYVAYNNDRIAAYQDRPAHAT